MNTLPFIERHLFQLLKQYEQSEAPLDLFVSQYFKTHRALGANDRRLIANTVFDMIRWLRLLEFVADTESHSWEKKFEIFKHQKRYLSKQEIPLPVRVSCPDSLWELLSTYFGEERAKELCEIFNTQAPITLRANSLKISRDELLAQLKEEGLDVILASHSPFGIHITKRAPLTSFGQFKSGLFEIQDEGSQLIASLVKAKPGNHILDYCAGSGGKTLAFAHCLRQKGQIFLHDVRTSALSQARKRCKRAGLQNVQFLDSNHPYLKKLKGHMDWILVDAPCSGTGTLRRNPDQKWKFSKELVERLVQEQRMIFKKALQFLKPNGTIIYATCSILPPENQDQIAHFCKTYGLSEVEEPLVTFPTENGMDGFFAASLKKVSLS